MPANVFAATISKVNITTSVPVGGQWPPFDAKLAQTGNYTVSSVRWEGEFDEYGRCKNGETYVGHFFFAPLMAWDAMSTKASVTINGMAATIASTSSSQKLEATVSFTAQQGEVKAPQFTAVEKFATGDCGLATSEYAQAVAWAVANGVTTGTGNGTTFSPDMICPRGQIVTFLIRAVK